MKTRQQEQQELSTSPPFLPPFETKRENFQKAFRFEYGFLDDNTLWIRTPSKGLFNVDFLTLRLLLELNAGAQVTPLANKYKVDPQEIYGLLKNLEREKAIVPPREGKITKASEQEDISISPFVFLFFILVAIQIEYFQKMAHTFVLKNWSHTLLIALISLIPILLHELGHYLTSRPYFPTRMGFTFLWFFPAVYIDTNPSWCLPRNIRLLINSAGILMDLISNTILIILVIFFPSWEYFITPLLILQYTRWSIILNPLVPGDGYWLLADFSRTINLRQKSRDSLRKRRFHWLSLYGFISILFSLFSILGLIWFVFNLMGLGARFF